MDDPAPISTEELADSAVAAGLRAGDSAAWATLYDAHADRVWRVVARLLGPGCESAVGDVVQETFLAAAKSARGYDPARGPLWGWLWGIARTQCALHRRTRARHARDPARELARVGSADGVDPLDSAAAREDAERVRTTLLELPADYGRLLAAKYLLDTPTDDLARAERVSVTAVRSKLARARDAFRERFARSTPTPPGGPT
jgi:RNA polymerase sigma-70 factor (ECF subfamily)